MDPLYFDHGQGNYLGCLMDGGVWDTILAAQALAQAGETLGRWNLWAPGQIVRLYRLINPAERRTKSTIPIPMQIGR
ncbi:MAG: hypothetical protein ACLQVJ_08660 [Syntrophobacteraceae bacterium]